jgi:phage gp46-like protein
MLAPPLEVVEIARCTMGSIDLDPFSCSDVNRIVQAARYADRSVDPVIASGRFQTQTSASVAANRRILLAVPSRLPMARALAERLLKLYRSGLVAQAVFWCGNSEILAACPWLWDFPICLPFRRLAPRYWDDEIEQPVRVSPAGWSPVVYLPPSSPAESFQKGLAAFSAAAGLYGRVVLDQWSGDNGWWPDSYKALTGKQPPGS